MFCSSRCRPEIQTLSPSIHFTEARSQRLFQPISAACALASPSAADARRRPRRVETVSRAGEFVALGKDGRALAVEPHATGGRVKLSRSAFDRLTNYRGVVANHLVRQVTGFRAFDKDSYRREDDLFDAAMYAVLVSLGTGPTRAGRGSNGPPDQGGAGGWEIAFRPLLSRTNPDGRHRVDLTRASSCGWEPVGAGHSQRLLKSRNRSSAEEIRVPSITSRQCSAISPLARASRFPMRA
jgi:hypothetical protein